MEGMEGPLCLRRGKKPIRNAFLDSCPFAPRPRARFFPSAGSDDILGHQDIWFRMKGSP
jgi:hypothetical protein